MERFLTPLACRYGVSTCLACRPTQWTFGPKGAIFSLVVLERKALFRNDLAGNKRLPSPGTRRALMGGSFTREGRTRSTPSVKCTFLFGGSDNG